MSSAPVPSVALVVLDGWGMAPDGPGNAVARANTPVFDELWARFPHTTLETSGTAVGLPPGQMGNSEVGHLNLGAGAVVTQDLARIDAAIADGSFFENSALLEACRVAREQASGRLHAVALVSDGGVHSGWGHIEAVIEMAADQGVSDLILHALTDGRDCSPTGGLAYVGEVERWLHRAGRIGTLGGRYWGMDRDRRWDRTQRAYDAIACGRGTPARTAAEAIEASYAAGVTDEFIEPAVIAGYGGAATGDPVIFVNFRPDRARQLTMALADPGFEGLRDLEGDGFDREGGPLLAITTMTRYRAKWTYPIAFEPSEPPTTLARVISERGERQLHVAETEKYAHVTYFFNGGREAEWEGEERILVDSRRDVPTYDLAPEMSAAPAAKRFCDRFRTGEYRFGVINFANPDMVGHSGVVDAAIRAVEEVDRLLGEVLGAVEEPGGVCVVTADHGNCEQMLEPDGSPNTAHSLNPVPLVVTLDGVELRPGGVLADVAPTVLALLGIDQSAEMTGRSLLGAR